MISLRPFQVRFRRAGSRARYFQKLFTSGTLRDFLMSSNTARTSREAAAYSIGCGLLILSSVGIGVLVANVVDPAKGASGRSRPQCGSYRRVAAIDEQVGAGDEADRKSTRLN